MIADNDGTWETRVFRGSLKIRSCLAVNREFKVVRVSECQNLQFKVWIMKIVLQKFFGSLLSNIGEVVNSIQMRIEKNIF